MDNKTIAIVAIAVIAMVSVGALLILNPWGSEQKDPDPEPEKEFPDLNEKVIVIYFSATETTAGVAEKIMDYLNADAYRIIPEVPYTNEDLQRDVEGSRVNNEHADHSIRPAIEGAPIDLSSYSTIVLGFPIWYHQEPNIIDTFLDIYDLSGKNVAIFATSWSAGVAAARLSVWNAEPDCNMLKGACFSTGFSESEIYDWLDSLGFEKKQ